MATKTITIDTDEWKCPDQFGITHTVTNAQTFTFELTDGGATAVVYQNDQNQSVTTTDGYRIPIFARTTTAGAAATNGNVRHSWGPTADAQDGVAVRNLAGEFCTKCPLTGLEQYWKASSLTVDNVDAPTAISGRFEDQFGNSFTWTNVTVS